MSSQITRDDFGKPELAERKLVPDGSIPKIRTYDLRVSTYSPTVRSGFDVRPELGCRIIHPNTGIEVTAEDERSSHKAKAAAMEKFEKAWVAYWSAKPDYPSVDLEKLVINYMMANSHPDMTNTGAYIVFISEDEVKSVGKQVASVWNAQVYANAPNLPIPQAECNQVTRETIALEIESVLDDSKNSLFRSGLKIAAGIARNGPPKPVPPTQEEAEQALLHIRNSYVGWEDNPNFKVLNSYLADRKANSGMYFANDGAERVWPEDVEETRP